MNVDYIAFDYCNLPNQEKKMIRELKPICDELCDKYYDENLTNELIEMFNRHKTRFIPNDNVTFNIDSRIRKFTNEVDLFNYLNISDEHIYTVTSNVYGKTNHQYKITLIDVPYLKTKNGTIVWKLVFSIKK